MQTPKQFIRRILLFSRIQMGITIKFDLKTLDTVPDTGKILFTRDAIETFPEWPEGPLVELINGGLYMVPSPTPLHQRISSNINSLMKTFVEERDLGIVLYAPVDVVFSEKDTTIPDLLFIKKSRRTIIGEKNIDGVPDILVEILSINRNRDLKKKKDLYEHFGVPEYWVIDPDDQLLMIHLYDSKTQKYRPPVTYSVDDSIKSEILPGFVPDLGEVFRKP